MIDERYKNGKIYLIKCNKTKNGYIGSTIMPLKIRLQKHETDYRGFMGINGNKTRNYRGSSEILINQDYGIQLLENYCCNNRKELEKRESMWIFKISATQNLTNKNMPGKIGLEDLDTINNLEIKSYI